MTDTTSAPPANSGRGTVVPLHASEPPPLEQQPPEDWADQPRNARTSRPQTGDRANSPDAERQVLGAALTDPAARRRVIDTGVTRRDFWTPDHELIWDTITTLHGAGADVDAVTVADRILAAHPKKKATGLITLLSELISGVITSANAEAHAQILREHTLRRDVQTEAERLYQAVTDNPNFDPITEVSRLSVAATTLRQRAGGDQIEVRDAAPDIDTFLARANDDTDTPEWAIPGILERQDRLIVTAGEGHGKSTLLRQLAIQAAAGIHPFTGDPMPPQRVLILDLENSERQSRRQLRPLRLRAGQHLDPTRLHVCCHVQGLNLAEPADQAWLDYLLTATAPDLLITGPIYKMAAGNPNDEKDAKPIAVAFDQMRARHDLTIILEAHSAKTPAGVNPKNRPKEPVGWSGWMRWPEFGIHIAEDGQITHWRGMREDREFPHALTRGGPWPWTTDTGQRPESTLDQAWPLIQSAVIRAGQRLTQRELADATGITKTTIQRTCAARSTELETLFREVEEANK